MYKKIIFLIFLVPAYSAQKVDDGRQGCIFPEYPDHGSYDSNIRNAKPGDSHPYIIVNITCQPTYEVNGLESVYCIEGWWVESPPTCVLSNKAAAGATSDRQNGVCMLPPYPDHGTYVSNIPNGKPGEVHEFLTVNVTCNQGYDLVGSASRSCFDGWWLEDLPFCSPSALALSVGNAETNGQQNGYNCIMPPYPDHGTYTTHVPGARPGQAYPIAAVNLTCHEGYVLTGPQVVHCFSGEWSVTPMPQCVLRCRLSKHPSIRYRCTLSDKSADGFRECKEFEPSGTTAIPECRTHYRPTFTHTFMSCKDGEWTDHIQKCIPDCGVLTPNGTELVLGGEVAKYGEVPWHAAIYRDSVLICGGSLVSTSIVITAAHCVWDNLVGRLPASEFTVAVGKLHRDINNKLGKPQWSNVEIIHVPPRFRGSTTSFQDDIAVMEMSSPFEYRPHIRPVCLDFDAYFESNQLQPGNKGQVAGWGFTTENGSPAEVLRVVELPYVDIDTCINKLPASFSPFITSDKICAGFHNENTALCKGDSGGGLTFPSLEKGKSRYYLRGVVSTAPTSDTACNPSVYTTFTRIIKHERLIIQNWRD